MIFLKVFSKLNATPFFQIRILQWHIISRWIKFKTVRSAYFFNQQDWIIKCQIWIYSKVISLDTLKQFVLLSEVFISWEAINSNQANQDSVSFIGHNNIDDELSQVFLKSLHVCLGDILIVDFHPVYKQGLEELLHIIYCLVCKCDLLSSLMHFLQSLLIFMIYFISYAVYVLIL